VNVARTRSATPHEQLRVARIATVVLGIVAVVLGIAFFQEPFTLSTAAGFLLILVGSWAATRRDPVAADSERSTAP
jgi:drug/metabolite transporter (DMT)-like permease